MCGFLNRLRTLRDPRCGRCDLSAGASRAAARRLERAGSERPRRHGRRRRALDHRSHPHRPDRDHRRGPAGLVSGHLTFGGGQRACLRGRLLPDRGGCDRGGGRGERPCRASGPLSRPHGAREPGASLRADDRKPAGLCRAGAVGDHAQRHPHSGLSGRTRAHGRAPDRPQRAHADAGARRAQSARVLGAAHRRACIDDRVRAARRLLVAQLVRLDGSAVLCARVRRRAAAACHRRSVRTRRRDSGYIDAEAASALGGRDQDACGARGDAHALAHGFVAPALARRPGVDRRRRVAPPRRGRARGRRSRPSSHGASSSASEHHCRSRPP